MPDVVEPAPRYLAVDLSASRLTAGVVDDTGTVLVRDRVATPPRHVWPTLSRLVSRVLAASPDDVRPVSCGVAVSGAVDRTSDTPVSAPPWTAIPLRERLAEVLDLDVTIDNAGRALAMGEAWCGGAVALSDFVAVVLSDSVDAGIVSGGKLLHGRSGNVGQIAHIVVEPNGRPCRCGNAGCLDAYAGALAIEAETSRPLQHATASVMEVAGIMLARAIASIVATVDTTHVFVGGSVPFAFGAPMFEALDRELEQRIRLGHLAGVRAVPVGPGSASALIGAAALARSARLRTANGVRVAQ